MGRYWVASPSLFVWEKRRGEWVSQLPVSTRGSDVACSCIGVGFGERAFHGTAVVLYEARRFARRAG